MTRHPRLRPTGAGRTLLICLVPLALGAGPPRLHAKRQGERTKRAGTTHRSSERLPERAAAGLYLVGPEGLIAGTMASYRAAVHWTTAPDRFGPLPGARVELSLAARVALGKRARWRVLARGRTEQTGACQLRFRVPELSAGSYRLRLRARTRYGRRSHETTVRIDSGARLFLSSDKNRYQPSQKIHARALALRAVDRRPLAGRDVVFRIADPKGTVVHRATVKCSRFGIAATTLQLADEINLGRYTIRATLGDADEKRTVRVSRYDPPRFRVRITAHQRYYRPGDMVRVTLEASYLFGKPVAGARVQLSASGPGSTYHPQKLVTDARGRAQGVFSLAAAPRRGFFTIAARVTERGGRSESATKRVRVTDRPLSLSLVSDARHLLAGAPYAAYAVASWADGRPARGVPVSLVIGGEDRRRRGRTDALGVVRFSLRGAGRRTVLRALARTRHGQSAHARLELGGAAVGVRVAPRRALFGSGQPIVVGVSAIGVESPRLAILELIKRGQTLVSRVGELAGGQASFSLRPKQATSGIIRLRATVIDRRGARWRGERLIYVDAPSQLSVDARADRASYRPGQRARVTFRVSDRRTEKPVQAALGVTVIDEALVALGGLPPWQAERFYAVAGFARDQADDLAIEPGGRGLVDWAAAAPTSAAGAARGRAIAVLLAALHAPKLRQWESDPWRDRRRRWRRQARRLIRQARLLARVRTLGRRTVRGWRFRPDLVALLVRAKKLPRSALRDPWAREVRPRHLHRVDSSFTFASTAAAAVRHKLARLYLALGRSLRRLRLRRERIARLPRAKRPLRLPQDLLGRLLAKKQIRRHLLFDPWGRRFRLRRLPHTYVDAYGRGLISRDVIVSAGPDGRFGSPDDVQPAGPRRVVPALIGKRRRAAQAVRRRAVLALLGGRRRIGQPDKRHWARAYGMGIGGGGSGSMGFSLRGASTVGRGGASVHVRSNFPETLLVRPQLITDASGKAELEVPLADSITRYRLLATASSATGALGSAQLSLRAFQPFFVRVELPRALTEGDRISVPVTVHNYRDKPQRVRLRLEPQSWYAARGGREATLIVGPNKVAVHRFSIVAERIGDHALTVHARAAAGAADAVRRRLTVEPDGSRHALSVAGELVPRAKRARARHAVALPARAISGASHVELVTYTGAVGQTLEGLEGMLRQPHGCFEQTSSTTYPNVLVLDYLRRTRQKKPEIERRARRLIAAGYQRLVSFEVPGGGFSWFGDAPANRVLTAYGLMEFSDMARVHPVDPALIRRTQSWLIGQQRPDGSWAPDAHAIEEGATNRYRSSRLRVTAYVAHALARTGYRGKPLARALGYVRAHRAKARDPYSLALLANLLGRGRPGRALRARLWRSRRRDGRGRVSFAAPPATLTHGSGEAGTIETTALAALAYLASGSAARAQPLLSSLVARRDSSGAWHSTQATILALRALLEHARRRRAEVGGTLAVTVDGERTKTLRLDGDGRSHHIDLTRELARGAHRLELRFSGRGRVGYQLRGRYWLRGGRSGALGDASRKAAGRRVAGGEPTARGGLAIRTRLSETRLHRGQTTRLRVEVENRGRSGVAMPLVSIALPPGFDVEGERLDALVAGGRVDKLQRRKNRVLLYLSRLGAGQKLRVTLPLRSRFPLAVQMRPSVVYEYYRPEHRASSRARRVEVL